ncbi:MAG: M23 family metallopeptidase [Clostridia bacterium]|nr:M23 family metallopeptidase [Clostridia bacterium]
MSEKPQNRKFFEKMKNPSAGRAAIITSVMLIAAVAVIISVSIANNRSKKDDTLPPVSTTTKGDSTTLTPPATTTKPTTTTTAPKAPAPVEDTLPSFSLPTNGVLSKKHDPTLQVYSSTMKDYRVHLGVDIVTEESAPVYAAADGKISKIWEDTLMGYCIAVKHSGDCYTIYKNLSETIPEGISEGVSVRAGQLIGTVGESAMLELAEEPHLHFEMTVADLAVDPLEYFDEDSLAALNIDASHGE